MPSEAMPTSPLPEGFRPANCTFAEADWPSLAAQWFPVTRADAPLAKPVQVVLLDVRLAIYRMPDGIRVGRDVCPHRGLPLTTGHIEGDELVCAYHGLRFGPDGQCRKAPEKLALKTPECLRVAMFPAVERYGLIWTSLMPQGEPEIPEIRSESSETHQGADASPIKFHGEFMEISIKFKNQTPQQEIARNEYRRLLEGMGLRMHFESERI